MSEWRRYPSACRADYELLVDGKSTGYWIKDCGHPTALRPYYVVLPSGARLDRKFKHVEQAKAAINLALVAQENNVAEELVQEMTYDLGADGKLQLVIPGAEQIGIGQVLQRKADAPLRPRVAQKPMAVGLFGDGHKQDDLFTK